MPFSLSPIHLAIAEVSKTGELLSYQTISLHHLLGLSQNSKDHQEWILAHQIVDLAIQKGKAIAIENLKKLKKGVRGDGKAELRKRLHQWNAKKFLRKLKRVAMLKGVEVIEVNPAYTSVIGMLKYAPQLNIDKDIAGAYVIGRRALGFKDHTQKQVKGEHAQDQVGMQRQFKVRIQGKAPKEDKANKAQSGKKELSCPFKIKLLHRKTFSKVKPFALAV